MPRQEEFVIKNKNDRKSDENPLVFLDICIDNIYIGKIIIELFADIVPKTAENFRQLCTGEVGIGKESNLPLTYKGTYFYSIKKGFNIHGGDITSNDGKGGESIYGKYFETENFELNHEYRGFLGMTTQEVNKNNSQFYITFSKTKKLNGKNVVFGQIISGFGVLRELEHVANTYDSEKPQFDCVIMDCGECDKKLDLSSIINYPNNSQYPEFVEDFVIPNDETETKAKLKAAYAIKEIGNSQYAAGQWMDALKSYIQALGYLYTNIYNDYEERLPEDYEEIDKLQIIIKINKAICLLKCDRPKQANRECSDVLFYDFNNAKARYKRAQARICLDKLDEAFDDLKIALQLDPNNKAIREEFNNVKLLLLKRREKLMKNYSKLFK